MVTGDVVSSHKWSVGTGHIEYSTDHVGFISLISTFCDTYCYEVTTLTLYFTQTKVRINKVGSYIDLYLNMFARLHVAVTVGGG